jgi:hypothetical protein
VGASKRRSRDAPGGSGDKPERAEEAEAEPGEEEEAGDHQPPAAGLGLLGRGGDRRRERVREPGIPCVSRDVGSEGGGEAKPSREQDREREDPEEEAVGETAAENATGDVLVALEPAEGDLDRRVLRPLALELLAELEAAGAGCRAAIAKRPLLGDFGDGIVCRQEPNSFR